MGTYRPSAQVVLYLRADEGAAAGPLTLNTAGTAEVTSPLTPPAVPQTAERADSIDAALRVYSRSIMDLEVRAQEEGTDEYAQPLAVLRTLRDQMLASRLAGTLPSRPAHLTGASPDGRYVRGGIIPANVEIERNGFRTADTCSITLAWKDAPFDPRLVRAAGVEVVLGVVSPDDYEAGLRGERDASGQLRSVIRQRPTGEVPGSAIRFVGWVDTWHVENSGDKAGSIVLECRDYTALFLDTPLGSGSGVDLTRPLVDGITELLATYPGLARFPVRYGDPLNPDLFSEATSPIPARVLPAVNRTRGGSGARRVRRGDQKMNVWDHLTDVCIQANLIPIVQDYTLWLCPPRTLLAGTPAGWADAGDERGQRTLRRMVYGRNLAHLEFTRKLGGVKVPTIEVRCYDPHLGRTRWARYPVRSGEHTSGVFGTTDPPAAIRPNEPGISGAAPTDRIQTILVSPMVSGEALAGVARGMYDQIGRQEIEGNLETSDVASWDIITDTPLATDQADLLKIQPGESLELLVAPHDPARPTATPGSVASLATLSREGRAQYLMGLGWEEPVARRFSEAQDGAGFQTIFRVQNSRVTFDVDEGIKIKLDFINYITVRDDGHTLVAGAYGSGSPATATVGGTIPNTPSPEVTARLAGRTDDLAQGARDASARRVFITQQRALGLATDVELENATIVESIAVAAAEAVP